MPGHLLGENRSYRFRSRTRWRTDNPLCPSQKVHQPQLPVTEEYPWPRDGTNWPQVNDTMSAAFELTPFRATANIFWLPVTDVD